MKSVILTPNLNIPLIREAMVDFLESATWDGYSQCEHWTDQKRLQNVVCRFRSQWRTLSEGSFRRCHSLQKLSHLCLLIGTSFLYPTSCRQDHQDISVTNYVEDELVGGRFNVYITITKEYADTNSKYEFAGIHETEAHKFIIYGVKDYIPQIRTPGSTEDGGVSVKAPSNLKFETTYTFTGYMFYHQELLALADRVGLSHQPYFARPASERLYDAFVFSRKEESK